MQRLSVLLALAGLVAASPHASANGSSSLIKCPIVFDGRVPSTDTLSDFDDASTSPFNSEYVKGANLLWSQILLFPSVGNSRFDPTGYKSVEVTITNASIFNSQEGFRRAGLLFANDSNTDSPGATGIKTLHFSVMQDPKRPLNLSHEYLNVWHETTDYSANQFNFETGTIIGQESLPKNTFKLLDRNNNEIWSTPVEDSGWQNFAVTLDYNENTLNIAYSKDDDPLVSQFTKAVSNDNSGGGQFQIGILKKPTGTTDVVNSGYQESPIDEGQIYGSIWVEDASNGCLSV